VTDGIIELVIFAPGKISNGVCERLFALGDIPGVVWTPAGAGGGHCAPLLLLGHGGGQHKTAPGVVARAHRFVACGFAVAAIDAPGYAGRPKTPEDERFIADIRQRRAAGEQVGPRIVRYTAGLAVRAVPEWRGVLDALQDANISVGGPVGFWGLSLGSMIGIPLGAAESRITAAVFGLVPHETLAGAAAGISIPVEFLLQWDDELVPRESGLALFDAFGSREKSLHANPGRHAEVPAFEVESSVRFFSRHLHGGA
jgi:pimeloyl-ACP methyl ester carboxylesterase